MESLNIYHNTFKAVCPNNGMVIDYDFTIETREVIMVEAIVDEVSRIHRGFHEHIADLLFSRFGGRQILVAHHHGVDIRTVRRQRQPVFLCKALALLRRLA